MIANQLQDYANGLGGGYLKTWKAISMVQTMRQIPGLTEDNSRLLPYLSNCLEMEGFNGYHVELVMRWVIENLKEIRG